MKVQRITLEVSVDLDGVPGAFHTPEDHAARLQYDLEKRFPHYRPIVYIQEDSIRTVESGTTCS